MKLSVVIPTWNGRRLLHLPLDSMRRQAHPDLEVIVVDDASTDDTVDFVRAEYPEVRLVALERNLGFPGAVNAGIRAATGEAVALLNNDAAADEGWASALVEALERHPEAGMVASRVLLHHHREYLDSAGIYVTTSGSVGNRGAFEEDGPAWREEAWVLGPNGAAALYRRSLLDDVGLLDEDYLAYYEDTDLALRAQFRGWKCLYEPRAACYHVGSATYARPVADGAADVGAKEGAAPRPTPPSPRVVYLAARNYPSLLLKFLPLRVLLADAWAIAAYELNFVLFALRRRMLSEWLRGRRDFLRLLPRTLAKRRRILATRTLSEAACLALFRRPTVGQYLRILRRRLGW